MEATPLAINEFTAMGGTPGGAGGHGGEVVLKAVHVRGRQDMTGSKRQVGPAHSDANSIGCCESDYRRNDYYCGVDHMIRQGTITEKNGHYRVLSTWPSPNSPGTAHPKNPNNLKAA